MLKFYKISGESYELGEGLVVPTGHTEYESMPEDLELLVNRFKELKVATSWVQERREAYPSLADQADMQFHDAVDGTTTWQDAIQAVKDAYPKP